MLMQPWRRGVQQQHRTLFPCRRVVLKMIIDSLLVLLPTRGYVSVQNSPRMIFCTRHKPISRQTFRSITTTLESFPSRSEKQKRKQGEYIESISEWKGAPHVTSKHVTHFIASGDDDMTVDSALWLVLPNIHKSLPTDVNHHSPLDNREQATVTEFIPKDESLGDKNLMVPIIKSSTGTYNDIWTEKDDAPLDTPIISSSLDYSSKRSQDIYQEELIGLSKGLDPQFRHDASSFPIHRSLLPVELLAMGSIWFLPHSAPRDSSLGTKPVRLQVQDLTRKLVKGDYLRVHHNPRRFPIVASYDWGKFISNNTVDPSQPGTIVARDDTKGYIVVHKPGALPVHASVDNLLENVCAAIGRAMVKAHEIPTYISAAQRLDQDTSGLFVVGTKPEFAAYFSKLLRNKTDTHLGVDANTKEQRNRLGDHVLDSVHKKYKCLVCLFHPTIQEKLDNLKSIVQNGEILRHYMEDSIRAPKVFVQSPAMSNSTWLECLLRITEIGPLVIHHEFNLDLMQSLWGSEERVPDDCVGVLELEIELLTGRTHQIRGQLALEGMPICGDTLYGGSKPAVQSSIPGYTSSGNLALQCCELDFYDPEYHETPQGRISSSRSNQLNQFRLDEAWWSGSIQSGRIDPSLSQHQ